jgi:hypothetical protein
MEAMAESIDCCPHEINTNGSAVLVSPSNSRDIHVLRLRGKAGRTTAMTSTIPMSPKSSRYPTNVKGGTSLSANLIHKKDDPQTRPNRPNAPHVFAFTAAP